MQTIGDPIVPMEYIGFQLCREFGWTPEDLDRMPANTVRLYHSFMLAEAEAGRIRALQSKHYAR